MNDITIAENIKRMRKEKGFTQKQLAEQAGTAVGTIQQYELGKRQPRLDVLERIANVLGTDIDKLANWNSEKSIEENFQNSPYATEQIRQTLIKGFKGKIFQIHFDTEDYTPTELLKIWEYAEFLRYKREKE